MLLPLAMTLLRTLHTIPAWILAMILMGQVHVDKPIILTGDTPASRQIEGISPTTNSAEAQSAAVEQSNAHRVTVAGVGPAWSVVISGLDGAPTAGTNIVVVPPNAPGSGAVSLSVNGAGPYAVLTGPGAPLLAEALSGMAPLSLVYDGADFHLMNGGAHLLRDCPPGMLAVTSQFCVEQDERPPVSFYEAARICTLDNKRLCSWGEWYDACQRRVELGLLNMNNNWEYVDDTSNEDLSVRVVGPSCAQCGSWYVSNAYQSYRCCSTR